MFNSRCFKIINEAKGYKGTYLMATVGHLGTVDATVIYSPNDMSADLVSRCQQLAGHIANPFYIEP